MKLMAAKPKKTSSTGGLFHRGMKWLLEKREQGPDLGHRLALVLSFLVAGILALINLDRNLHQASSAKIGYQASQHGWPMIYLNRQFDEAIPNHLRAARQLDWPYPAVQGENRTFNLLFLVVDLLTALAIIAVVYWATRWLAQ